MLDFWRTFDIANTVASYSAICKGYKTKFTESEIKELDERYWQFRVPVEDLEETK
ncbi:TPA: DUF1642 domain-containing protein [Listeria monocytogenes]|nr:DUF1642 domain-containing protein [Listeria monocytogenes]HBZ6462242.1 DUF1642 domain-containing protein [Listeria monocytogenes]